jgi:hypothetical protein
MMVFFQAQINSVSGTDDYSGLDEMMGENAPYDNLSEEAPAAEDVLVQKIPGDNQHMLIMAVYSFAKYSGPYIKTRYNNSELVLRDDGEEFDKVAGDGVFTAKIYARLMNSGKRQLKWTLQCERRNTRHSVSGRELKPAQDCIVEPFDLQKLDQNQPFLLQTLQVEIRINL